LFHNPTPNQIIRLVRIVYSRDAVSLAGHTDKPAPWPGLSWSGSIGKSMRITKRPQHGAWAEAVGSRCRTWRRPKVHWASWT